MNQNMSLAEFETFVSGLSAQTYVYNSRDQQRGASVPEFQYCFRCIYVDMMRELVVFSREDDASRLVLKGIKAVTVEPGIIADVYVFSDRTTVHKVLIKKK